VTLRASHRKVKLVEPLGIIPVIRGRHGPMLRGRPYRHICAT
jgi:hypothetical protein